MKGIILAAGRGSRMGVLTSDQTKCMTHLLGKPMVSWQLDALRGADVADLAIVRGYLAESFTLPVTYFDNPQWESTQMVCSLACAAPWLESDDCIVSYSDIVYTSATVEALKAAPGDLAITYDPDWAHQWSARFEDPLSDAETFRLQGDVLTEIGQTPTTMDEVQGQYMGLLKFTPRSWSVITDLLERLEPARRNRLDMTSLLQLLIESGMEIHAVPCQGPWCEVDQESDIAVGERIMGNA